MLLKLFKTNHPIIFLLVPIVAAAFWLPDVLFNPSKIILFDADSSSPLYKELFALLKNNYAVTKSLAFILFVAEGFLLMRLNYKYTFVESKTYLPAILFVVIGSAFPFFQNLHPLLIANLFIILAFNRCFEISKDKNQLRKYYESGFLLGLGGLFYFPSFIMLLIIWLTQIVLRTFNWREWISSIIGFATPILLYITYLFLFSNHLPYVQFLNGFWLKNPSDIVIKGLPIYLFVLIGVIISIAFLYNLSIIGVRKISTRKYFVLMLWMLAISFVSKIFLPFLSTSIIYVFAMPACFILTMFFVELKSKWISESFFYLLIFSIITVILFQVGILSY